MEMDFEKICRTCLSGENSTLVSIFENNITDMSESESSSVIDLLTTLTNIKISANDCLPDQICPACIDEIKRAYSFKLKCENSEKVLNKYLQGYCKSLCDKADSNVSSGQFIAATAASSRTMTPSNKQSYAESICIKEELIDDIVSVSDDESVDNKNEDDFIMSNDTANEPEQIEISDDDDDDDDGDYDEYGYHTNGAYAIDDDSFQDNSENVSDSQSPFVIQDYYSLQEIESEYIVCPGCTQMYKTANELKRHIKDNHTKGVTCILCQRDFSSISNLFEHCAIHIPIYYPCPICGYKLKQEKYLKKHLERHTRDKEVKCDLCDEMFLTSSEMRVHSLLIHVEEKDATFKCDVCGMKLTNQELLDSHKEKHNLVVRNHVCDICSKAFRSKTKLTEHYRLHTGEKPHVCVYCHKKFRLQFSLRMHMAIHTNEHFFKCRICYMTFRQRSELQKHIQLHRDNMI